MNFFASIKRVLGGEPNFFSILFLKKELLCIGVRSYVFSHVCVSL